MKRLESYCDENDLIINVKKTQIMIFHKGSLSADDKIDDFYLYGKSVSVVKVFKYLGIIFTPRLSFSEHLKSVHKKARAKHGICMKNLNE